MAFGDAGREVVSFNESWTDTSFERTNIAFTTNTHIIVGQTETVLTPPPRALATFLTKLPSSESCEPRLWLPTQVEVDAYINSLEQGHTGERKRMCQVEGTESRLDKTTHTKSSTFWWWVAAALIGCIYWVLRS